MCTCIGELNILNWTPCPYMYCCTESKEIKNLVLKVSSKINVIHMQGMIYMEGCGWVYTLAIGINKAHYALITQKMHTCSPRTLYQKPKGVLVQSLLE
jgi:hypothetical protein